MVNKRKRDDSSEFGPDEITPGKQILPVANLPLDFDQEPRDGMQYLFLVRRDARRLPHITRVQNPYEVPEAKVAPTSTPLFTDVLPCEEWRDAFQMHFSNLRKNLTQGTFNICENHSSSTRRVIPEKKDRDAWWKFLAGHPESAWSPMSRGGRKNPSMSYRMRAFTDPAEVPHPDHAITSDLQSRNNLSHPSIACIHELPRNISTQPNSFETVQIVDSRDLASFVIGSSMSSEEAEGERIAKPPEVTPSYLREIDHRMSIHLLMYFTHWINVHLQNLNDPLKAILASHGRWIFALLTKVEDRLSADEMNLLRNLARACLGLIQKYDDKRAKGDAAVEGVSCLTAIENKMSNASCWMVFAAVAGQWGQKDLWDDAKIMLASV